VASLHAPVRGVAAGQGLVLYDGARVLAAGRILSAGAAPAA
jgi:tRNA U34 2-thiouridine synthase MnmA/TrmU